MKKLFIYLTIGVSLLMSCKNRTTPEQEVGTSSEFPQIQALANGGIVYVELDSLTNNYLMTKDLEAELEKKVSQVQTDMDNRRRRFQQSVTEFQRIVDRQLETRARIQEMGERLAQDEQNLVQLAERYQMEIAEEQMTMQRRILQSIMDYLEEYNREKGYKYILGNAFGSNVLYADPSLNITAEVLEGINAKYRAANR